MEKTLILAGLFLALCVSSLAQNIGATSREKITYIYQVKEVVIDTLICDDSDIPENKRAEAYQKGSAVYDSAIIKINYNRKHLWFSRSFVRECKVAKFDATKKEIRSGVIFSSSEEWISYELIIIGFCSFLILFSIFFVITAEPENREMTDESVFGTLLVLPGIVCGLTILIFSLGWHSSPLLWKTFLAYAFFTMFTWLLSATKSWTKNRYALAQCFSYLIVVTVLYALTQDLFLVATSVLILVGSLFFFRWATKE